VTPPEINDGKPGIAPNGATVLVGVLSLLLGVIVTFVIALAPIYALAHAWGWLLSWQGAAVATGSNVISAHVTSLGWWLPPVIMAGITLLLFLGWWLTIDPYKVRKVQAPRTWLDWLNLNAMAGAAQSESAPKPGLLAKLAGWLRQRLMPWTASAVIVLFGLVLAVLWTIDGVRARPGVTLWQVLAALAVMLVTRIGAREVLDRLGQPGESGKPGRGSRIKKLRPLDGQHRDSWWAYRPLLLLLWYLPHLLWDVLAYARSHPAFPCNSTLEQLYDAVEFEAYHQLGAAAAIDAAKNCEPPLRRGTAAGLETAPYNGHQQEAASGG